MKSMTYGVMPSKAAFHTAWMSHVGAHGHYPYTLRGSDAATAKYALVPTEGNFGEARLYGILKKLRNAWNHGDENAGDIASSILQTLGFEWI